MNRRRTFRLLHLLPVALLALACGRGGSPTQTTRNDDAMSSVSPFDATATAMKTPPRYAVVTVRSVRIFDAHGPDDPDVLPKVKSDYGDGPAGAGVPLRTDALPLADYSARDPRPVVVDESRTIAVRDTGEQTFALQFGGDHRLLVRCGGFQEVGGGSALTMKLLAKSNYGIRLPGQGSIIGPNTASFSGTIAVGSTLIDIDADQRAGQLFLGTWIGVTIESIGAELPATAIASPDQDSANVEQTWNEWATLEKSAVP